MKICWEENEGEETTTESVSAVGMNETHHFEETESNSGFVGNIFGR